MNPNLIKEELLQNINKEVEITVFGMRNKINTYYGKIKSIYPNLFTIFDGTNEKSFNYRDIITKDIKVKYK